jgi:hypothetical protein
MTNLEDKNFGDNLITKIKDEKISPKPKWRFLLKNSLIWIMGFISLILGAVATSLIFYMLTGEEFIFNHPRNNIFEALLFVIPFFWIICLALFSLLVYYYIKHTKKGYKYSARTIIVAITVISIVFGGALSALGVDRLIDDTLGARAPMYDKFINPRIEYWSNPADGRLTGMITDFLEPNSYTLIDPSGLIWIIKIDEEKEVDKVIIDRPIRVLGEDVGEQVFDVEKVLSVGPGRGFLKKTRQPLPPGMNSPQCENEHPCINKNIKNFDKNNRY